MRRVSSVFCRTSCVLRCAYEEKQEGMGEQILRVSQDDNTKRVERGDSERDLSIDVATVADIDDDHQ